MIRSQAFKMLDYFNQDQQERPHWDEINQIPSQRLLVVDDEAQFRDAFRRLFWHYGFEVFTAANVAEASQTLDQYPFDIVLLDIKMAELDGAVLFGIIRALHKNIKVVICSVYPLDEQKERIKQADAYFDKSDGRNCLLAVVSSLINKKTAMKAESKSQVD